MRVEILLVIQRISQNLLFSSSSKQVFTINFSRINPTFSTSQVLDMEKTSSSKQKDSIFETWLCFLRKCIFGVISIGPIPNHIAFIMDGNRRFTKKQNLIDGEGHRAGFSALMSMLRYCYELPVKYVTVYAFSIDNFKRSPEEVQSIMELMQEKIETLIHEESIVNRYGIRVYFIGNLELLTEPVRKAAKRAMQVTANNSKAVLSICIAYTSSDEIVHAVQESCKEKLDEKNGISLNDVERNLYMRVSPDPDIVIRTSGETRLSNFLLWQSEFCILYSPVVLWPEIGFRHLVCAILDFQRNFKYFKIKRES